MSTLPSNKTIWTMWYQGAEQAPDLVKLCWDSWKHFNPDYKLICIDKDSLAQYVDLENIIDLSRKDLSIQKVSNLIRISLLQKYGGIWADATLFCAKPLDEWLVNYYTNDFFVFDRPGRDRLFANWFFATEVHGIMIENIYHTIINYYKENYFSNQKGFFLSNFFSQLNNSLMINPYVTLFWDSYFAKKILRAYPYFIFHYLCNKLILTNPDCKKIWEERKTLSAEKAFHLFYDKTKTSGSIIVQMAQGYSPVYKLNWRKTADDHVFNEVVSYLRSLLN